MQAVMAVLIWSNTTAAGDDGEPARAIDRDSVGSGCRLAAAPEPQRYNA